MEMFVRKRCRMADRYQKIDHIRIAISK